MDAQVAVIGVGSIGSMAMWQLAKAGVSAIGFEQYGLAHDQAAAGGESRIFRTAYMEGPQYVPLLQRSLQLWRELERETGRDVLTLNGGLMIGRLDADEMRHVQRSIEDFDLVHEVLDHAAMAARYPQHSLAPNEGAILDCGAGVLRPEFAVSAAAHRAQELGATVLPHTRVSSVEETGTGVRVRAGERTYTVEQAIITAGPWTDRFVPELRRYVAPRRLVMTWYLAKDPDRYCPEAFPIFIRSRDGYRIFGFPTLDGGSVKVAPFASKGGFGDADQLDRNVSIDELARINAIVAECLPGLIPDPIRVSAYMDAYSEDGHALVGRAPDTERVWLLGAFSGHGFKLAPAFGEAAAQLARTGATELPIGHLDPSRYSGR